MEYEKPYLNAGEATRLPYYVQSKRCSFQANDNITPTAQIYNATISTNTTNKGDLYSVLMEELGSFQ